MMGNVLHQPSMETIQHLRKIGLSHGAIRCWRLLYALCWDRRKWLMPLSFDILCKGLRVNIVKVKGYLLELEQHECIKQNPTRVVMQFPNQLLVRKRIQASKEASALLTS